VATRQEVLDHFRSAVLRQDAAALTDGQLLDCFLRNHDEAAFAALVRQHGPMVWGVCRRILADHHDAEDAFQATFLVLVRRAADVVPRELVANWLYGVAHQTALKARTMAGKRRARETTMAHLPEAATAGRDPWDDLRPVLDQELSRLPDKYRVAIVLCDLEGKTRKAAARQLRIPEGTVSSRLSTARALLAKRLARHGLALSAGSLAALLTDNAAAVPGAVVASTIQNACLFAAGRAAGAAIPAHVVALTEGVFSMSRNKLKIATTVVLASALIYFAGLPFFPATASGQGDAGKEAKPQDRKTAADAWKNVLTVHARLDKIDARNRTISAQVVSDLERVYRVYPVADLVIPIQKKLDVNISEDGFDMVVQRQPTQLLNLPVANDAKITGGGKALKLADLKSGMAVTLSLATDSRGLVVGGIRKSDRAGEAVGPDDAEMIRRLEDVRLQEASVGQNKPAEKKSDGAKKDQAALQGTWYVAAVEDYIGGRRRQRDSVKAARWVFLGDQIATFDPRSSDPENDVVFRYGLNATPKFREVRLVIVEGRDKGRVYLGVYELEGNRLRILLQKRQGGARPTEFTPREDAGFVLWEFRRTPPK
jgi:RNA polymerase sigma factor (sigma-70 family)